MGYDLYAMHGYFRWNYLPWHELRGLARAYGWKPEGTLPPRSRKGPDWNGNYHFNSGFLGESSDPFAQSIEATASGQSVFILQAVGGVYRSFRLKSLYAP